MANVVRRTLRCTRTERAEIRERAAALGMSVSGYLVACALHEDAGGPRRDATSRGWCCRKNSN
ncbi:MAG: hypothetical protein OXC15_09810 [Rhodospirillaceae bacterium]|nr:hypothetical protein [Rhodospirillaceae bacterium]